MKNSSNQILKESISILMKVGEFQKKNFKKNLKVYKKKNFEYFTEIDLDSENLICNQLSKLKIPIFSEELNNYKTTEDTFFIVDPLDGTNNYINGFPFYGASISFFSPKKSFTLINIPQLEIFFKYTPNQKSFSFLTEKRNHKYKILHNFNTLSNRKFDQKLSFFMNKNNYLRSTGCAVYDIYAIYSGLFDFRIFLNTKIYDYAPAIVIAKHQNFVLNKIKLNSFNDTENYYFASKKFHKFLNNFFNK